MSTLSRKDANDLRFITRDQAVDVVIRLMEERDVLLEALRWIATVNAMDYEYQEKARAAIAKAGGEV